MNISIKLRFLLIIFIMVCLSCTNDLLNQDPEMGVDDASLIQDQRGAEVALNGLYSLMKDSNYYGGLFLMMSDLSSDISQSVGTFDAYLAIDTYQIAPTLAMGVGNLWNSVYRVINQANFIIQHTSELQDIDSDVKNQILGEAHFIRALAYFDLTRSFGGVEGVYGTLGIPIVLEPTISIDDISFPFRSSIAESYRQVESDLLEAQQLLGSSGTSIRVSKAAAEALLSRLYLYYKQDYNLVEAYATTVIDDYTYNLYDNYIQIFSEGGTNETILELYSSTDEPSQFFYYYAPASRGGRNEFKLHDGFVNFLQSRPGDIRIESVAYSNDAGTYWPIKYAKSDQSDNVQILRLAEMYLNRAEARVQKDSPDLSGALGDLNKVRNRAGLADTTGTGVNSPDKIMKAIEIERMAEFFEEGHRWFDLIRTDRALSVLQNVVRHNGSEASLNDGFRQVWPIPTIERSNNENLEQNVGY